MYKTGSFDRADISLGNTWGLVRWHSGEEDDWVFQLNVEGMGFSRFHVTGGVNEFETVDFFLNLPVELRKNLFSARFMLFHQSSHLGDDFIRRTGSTGFRYSIEGVRLTTSFDLHDFVRVYGGGMKILHDVPGSQKGELQWGFEVRGPSFTSVPEHESYIYLGQDFKSRGKNEWNINSNTELGLRVGSPGAVRAFRIHLGYFNGHSQYSQFFLQREAYWNFGISFDF